MSLNPLGSQLTRAFLLFLETLSDRDGFWLFCAYYHPDRYKVSKKMSSRVLISAEIVVKVIVIKDLQVPRFASQTIAFYSLHLRTERKERNLNLVTRTELSFMQWKGCQEHMITMLTSLEMRWMTPDEGLFLSCGLLVVYQDIIWINLLFYLNLFCHLASEGIWL